MNNALNRMPPAWTDFFIMAGAFLLILTSALIWLVFFRKTRKRRRKYRHRHQHRLPGTTTLAQTGGLPPVRREEKPPGPPPSLPEP